MLLVLPSAQIKLGASQLNGLIGSYGGGYPGGGSWHSLPCDASGVLLPSPNYDQDGFCALTGTQTGSATTTYPPFMRAAAQNDPADYEWYLTAFSPAREIYFPYAAGPVPAVAYPGFDHKGINLLGDSWARNYATTNYGNVSGTYTVPDGSGGVVSGLINGTVKTAETGTVTAYFKWFYLDTASQPATPPLGDAGPPDRMDVVLHSRVSAWASLDYGTPTYGNPPVRSGLSAAASASDGLGDSVSPPAPAVTPTQPAAFSSQTLETPFLVHPVPSGNGAAAVSVTGSTSTNVSNAVGFGAYGPYPGAPGSGGYYQVTTGATSAAASSYVTARTQAVTALTADSTLESAYWQPRKPRFFSGTNCTVTGSLTLPPPFTILHAQLSVNSVVVQEYDDKALTPLSADPRAVYTVGTNQASVSLPTTFDATVYPEGYVLPLKLTVRSSRGGPFVFDLSAPAHLPQLTPYVLWAPDYTAAPVNGQLPQALAPSGTPMGGNSTPRVRVAYPPTASGTLTELRLHFHADADATRDIVFSAVPLRLATTQNQAQDPYAAWAILCGDPDPALTLSAPCAYAEVPWNPSAGLRNGPYDLTSAVTVQSSDGVTRTWTSSPFTVDREDLLITSTIPVNPAPLLWDPDKISPATGSPDPLPLSAAFHAAYKATGTMTLQIYTSDQTLVRTLTKAILTTDGTTDAGTPMTWDGRGEPVNGQPGAVQPRGVFLFQWSVSDSVGLTDSDKSSSLSFGIPATTISFVAGASDAAGRTVTLGYLLADSSNIAPSSCQLDVYQNWDLQDILPNKPLQAALGANQSTVIVPPTGQPAFNDMVQGTRTIYLVSPQDNDAPLDRGQRNRYALQHNGSQPIRTLLTWGGYYPKDVSKLGFGASGVNTMGATGGQADIANGVAAKLGYNLWQIRGPWPYLPAGDKRKTDVTPEKILYQDLPAIADPANSNRNIRDDCRIGLMAHCVDVAIFCGHGSDSSKTAGTIFMFGEDPDNLQNPANAHDYFCVTDTQASLATWDAALRPEGGNPGSTGRESWFWSIDQTNVPLWGMRSIPYINNQPGDQPVLLVMWVGCNTAGSFGGGSPFSPAGSGYSPSSGLPAASYNMGAVCSIGFQTTWQIKDLTQVVKNLATARNYQMQGPRKEGFTVYQALHHAVKDALGLSGNQMWQKYTGISYRDDRTVSLGREFYLPQGDK